MELDMTLKEIEQERYRNMLRIESIEAEVKRVSPFSEEFSYLIEESLRLQEVQRMLWAERLQKTVEMYYGYDEKTAP